MSNKVTQRMENPNWRHSNVTALAMCRAMHAVAGTTVTVAPYRQSAISVDESRAVTQPMPILR